jgi:NADH-quinone oxidoreductase subunit N
MRTDHESDAVNPATLITSPASAATLALLAAAAMLALERSQRGVLGRLGPLVVLTPLAAGVAASPIAGHAWPALAVGLVVAVLARNREDLLHSESALKLLWVMAGALALSWAGFELLVLATGTAMEPEQWAVLELGLDPRFLWQTALPLSLLLGLVLLGGAPFHFWAADLFQGVRPWLAPLAVAGLQVAGAGWLMRRLDGIEAFPAGAALTHVLLGVAALIALLVGAATLSFQRRPERRVGTLASLNGALVLATLATTRGNGMAGGWSPAAMGQWSGHLALALAGAGTLARFVPVSMPFVAAGPVLFRRHPWSALMGMFALFSLAGIPGTPGSRFWLATARDLAASGRTWLLLALGVAWLAALSAAVRQLRETVGVRVDTPPPEQSVPWQARAALWLSGGGLLLAAVLGR